MMQTLTDMASAELRICLNRTHTTRQQFDRMNEPAEIDNLYSRIPEVFDNWRLRLFACRVVHMATTSLGHDIDDVITVVRAVLTTHARNIGVDLYTLPSKIAQLENLS